jgi:hypothetical protein
MSSEYEDSLTVPMEKVAYRRGFYDGIEYAMFHAFWRGFSYGGTIMLVFLIVVFILLKYTEH